MENVYVSLSASETRSHSHWGYCQQALAMLAVVLPNAENDCFFWTRQKIFLTYKFQPAPASLKGMLYSSVNWVVCSLQVNNKCHYMTVPCHAFSIVAGEAIKVTSFSHFYTFLFGGEYSVEWMIVYITTLRSSTPAQFPKLPLSKYLLDFCIVMDRALEVSFRYAAIIWGLTLRIILAHGHRPNTDLKWKLRWLQHSKNPGCCGVLCLCLCELWMSQ